MGSGERRYLCCPCCEGIALDDHAGHGGDVEADGHDVPCTLHFDSTLPRPAVRATPGGEE